MIRRAPMLPIWVLCALLAAPAAAVDVMLRPATDGAGTATETRIRITLVDAKGAPVQAARTTDSAPVVVRKDITLAATDDPQALDLAPQTTLARADAASTYYVAEITADGVRERWTFQVPASAGPHEIPTLAAASAIEPGSILAGRLPPDPSSEPDGRWITSLDGAWVATDAPPGSGATDLTELTDGPGVYGTAGQVPVVNAEADGWEWADQTGGGSSHDAVTLAGTLDYLTLDGQAITRGAIDLATDTTGTLAVASGGTGQTSLGSVDAADLGSGAGTDGYALLADGIGGAAWEAMPGESDPVFSAVDTLAELNSHIRVTLDTSSDARTPSAHASSHGDGGADEIAIDASQLTSGTLGLARGGLGLDLSAAAGVPVVATGVTTMYSAGSLGLTMLAAAAASGWHTALQTADSGLYRYVSGTASYAVSSAGAAFPTSPSAGDLHMRTDRSDGVLYQYSGSEWKALAALGDVEVCVDDDGNGDPWDTDASGCATTGADALNALPPIVRGDVLVSVRAGTYSGDWSLPPVNVPSGATKKLVGELTTVLSTTAGSNGLNMLLASAQRPSITTSDNLTTSAHAGQWLMDSNGDAWAIWDNTGSGDSPANTIYLAGDWDYGANAALDNDYINGTTPAPSDAITIVSAAATITGAVALSPDWTLARLNLPAAGYYAIRNSFFAVKFAGAQVRFDSGTALFGAGQFRTTSSRALYLRLGVSAIASGCAFSGGPNTLHLTENSILTVRGIRVQQTVGTAGYSAVVTGGAKMLGTAGSNVGADIYAPSMGGGGSMNIDLQGGTVGMSTGNHSIPTPTVNATSTGFATFN